MKTKSIYKLLASGCGIILCLTGCTDKWDTHYQKENGDETGKTLWETISTRDDLSNFARVVKECGYDFVLNGSQTFTVFVPLNDYLTAAQADSLIKSYTMQRANGIKDDDNWVIRQFLQSHLALYRHSVSSLTNDTITMMNGKYNHLTQSGISGYPFELSNERHSNGVLYTIKGWVDYYPNVFEYLGMDADLDSVYRFINSYSVYEFNANLSVPGDIEDGETVYLDSVMQFSNSLLTRLGDINKEDSTYWMVAPTNTEWERLLNEYREYFVYDKSVAKNDSMQESSARLAIIKGSFFSRTLNTDAAVQDSAVSTMALTALERQITNMNYYIYYRPFDEGGVFDGTEKIACSNGHVLKAGAYNINKSQTFMQTVKIEAENLLWQENLLECEAPLTIHQVTTGSKYYNRISGNAYVDVIPKNTSTDADKFPAPKLTFLLPETFSNVGYDIYVVFAPVEAANPYASIEERLPNRVRGVLSYNNIDGKAQTKRLSVLETTPDKVDTLLCASNVVFPTCGYGLPNPVVKLQLLSQVSRNQTSIYSNTMHIDCIILKPHEESADVQ